MSSEPTQLDLVLNEIEGALKAQLYYVAVVIALTIPDLCAALETEDGRTNDKLYKRWYDQHLSGKCSLTADVCYSLRCGIVHQGRMQVANQHVKKVLFKVRDRKNNYIIHDNLLGSLTHGSVLQLDAEIFCKDVIKAARSWWIANSSNPLVIRNAPDLVRLRPNGLYPWIQGIPVIA